MHPSTAWLVVALLAVWALVAAAYPQRLSPDITEEGDDLSSYELSPEWEEELSKRAKGGMPIAAPMWFHSGKRGGPIAAPLWFHTSGIGKKSPSRWFSKSSKSKQCLFSSLSGFFGYKC